VRRRFGSTAVRAFPATLQGTQQREASTPRAARRPAGVCNCNSPHTGWPHFSRRLIVTGHRFYDTVALFDGALLVRRDDGGDDLFLSVREALKSGVAIHAGDRVEFSISPGASAVDVMLCAYSGERHRV
jgi:cold shock CspA family protein